MPFRPNPNDELTINGTTYYVAEHPAAPGMPYGQEGRAGIVYRLLSSGSEGQALKVFKPRFRLPYLVSKAEKLAACANMPGLQAARRAVLTPTRQTDLLRQHPDLTYAVLMPWIEGPTWLEIVLEKKPFTPEHSLSLARSLADVMVRMEERGLAHCDLSGPNVMLPALAGGEGVALIDLEGLYAPGMIQPQALSSGSAGYAHQQASGGLWEPESDRFAGAVLLAEMLGWCDPQICQASWGESYFEPKEMQQEGERYRALVASLHRHWGDGVSALFERAWRSDSLSDCPTFGEWLVALPVSSEQVSAGQEQEATVQPAEHQAVTVKPVVQETLVPEVTASAQVETVREVRAFMQAARRMEENGKLDEAIDTYHQAQELATSDPALRSLANEIALTLQDLETRQRGTKSFVPARPVSPASPVVPVSVQPAAIENRPARKGKGWIWALVIVSLVIVGLIVACLIGWGIQQQQAEESALATAQAQAQATAQAQALATATAWAQQATATAQARAFAAQATAESLQSQGIEVFGPESGTIVQNPNDNLQAVSSSDVTLRNFITEVVVHNPYNTAENPWSYSIVFRQSYTADYAFFLDVSSDASWELTLDDGGRWSTISQGYLQNLDTSVNGSNQIRLIATDNVAAFYLNDEFIDVLDISGNTNSGDVRLVVGIEIVGKTTPFSNFTVWELP